MDQDGCVMSGTGFREGEDEPVGRLGEAYVVEREADPQPCVVAEHLARDDRDVCLVQKPACQRCGCAGVRRSAVC